MTVCVIAGTGRAEAYSGAVATCWRAPSSGVVIDGVLSEWNTSSAIVIASKTQAVRDANQWTGPEDLSAEIYLMWDEANLYLAAQVRDDTPFMYREGFPPELADSIGLYFSTNPSADPARAAYDSSDFRAVLIVDNYYFNTGIDREMVADKKGIETAGDGGDEQVLKGYECAVTEIKGGYVFEAKIPLSNFANDRLPVLKPEDGVSIGFDLDFNDLDFPCPGVATTVMAWTGDMDIRTSPSEWGSLVFKTGGTTN